MTNPSINKTGTKKEQKRQALLLAAAKTFSKKGYLDCSIKNITEEANVSVGSFYSYFSCKEEVLEQLYDEIYHLSLTIATAASFLSKDNVVKQFTQAMTAAIVIYVHNKELSKILLIKSLAINEAIEQKRFAILEKTNDFIKQMLHHLSTEHSVKIENLDVTSVLLTQSTFGAITYYVDDLFSCSLSDLVFPICTYHLNALRIEYSNDEVSEYINEILTKDYETILLSSNYKE